MFCYDQWTFFMAAILAKVQQYLLVKENIFLSHQKKNRKKKKQSEKFYFKILLVLCDFSEKILI